MISIDEWRSWIGNSETVVDHVTPRLAASNHATFDLDGTAPVTGEAVPAGFHWLLCPPIAPWRELGPDGHPARGGFLPPVPLPRRMWAGSTIELHEALRVGDEVTRTSTVGPLSAKRGRSGELVFLEVDHRFEVDGELRVRERQRVVYREQPPADAPVPGPAEPEPLPQAAPIRRVVPDTTMLFRYSAITFNGHRIHYDADYCRDEEGYPGCVIHGPITGTLLLQGAQAVGGGRPIATLDFRARSPAFIGDSVNVYAQPGEAHESGPVALRALKDDGTLIMSAEATFHD